jgi:GT2 family glycosyltransferase
MVDLSIIIVNYRSRGLVRTCLRGIAKAKIRYSYEVLVVDNASNDGCVEMIWREFPDVRVFAAESNRGLASGNNIGIRAANGRYLLIINPDIALFEGMVERLIDYLERNPNVALVAPKLINPDGTIQYSIYRFPTLLTPLLRRTFLANLPSAKKILRSYLMFDWDRNKSGPVDWVLGACMLVRREAYNVIGEMDERYFLYFEDVDWCRRFWAAGYEVHYVSEAQLVHYHRRLSAEIPGLSGIFTRATRIHITSWMRYLLKYRTAPWPRNRQA